MPDTRRKPRNLSLDPKAVARGEQYSKRVGTTLSRLVEDFLRALPTGRSAEAKSPLVRRLHGVAATARSSSTSDFHDYLHRKYGGR